MFFMLQFSFLPSVARLRIRVILVKSKQDWHLTETARNVSQSVLKYWYLFHDHTFSVCISFQGGRQHELYTSSCSSNHPSVMDVKVALHQMWTMLRFRYTSIKTFLQEMHLSALKLKTYLSPTKIKRPTDSLCDKSQPRILKCQNNVSATNTKGKKRWLLTMHTVLVRLLFIQIDMRNRAGCTCSPLLMWSTGPQATGP